MPDPDTADTATAPRPRFQRLRDRLAGRSVNTTLRRDVPTPLETFLRQPALANALLLEWVHDGDPEAVRPHQELVDRW